MRWQLKLKILMSLGRRRRDTAGTAGAVNWRSFFRQYILGTNKTAYWPVHPSSTISGAEYILTGTGTAPGLSHGCYIFASKDSPVTIGDYTIIAPNVGIAGYNHDMYDYRKYQQNGPLTIGSYCWIGMNAVILPGIHLGDHTIVAAGAVVTSDCVEGYAVLAGNPARVIRTLDKDMCKSYRNEHEYVGYLTKAEFDRYKNQIVLTR